MSTSTTQYIPNILQTIRFYGAAALSALCDGIGLNNAADWFREKQKSIGIEIEATKSKNAAMRKDVAISQQQNELKRDRIQSEEDREKTYASQISNELEHKNRLKSEKDHAAKTKDILHENKTLLNETIQSQQGVKSAQNEVRSLQNQSGQLRVEIAKETKVVADEYHQLLSKAQLFEEQGAATHGKIKVESVQHRLALRIIDKQVELTIEMAHYKHDLKSATLEQKQELNKKIEACKAKQDLYLTEISSKLTSNELKTLAGFMKDKMQAEYFQRIQQYRSCTRTEMKEAIDQGVRHADTGRIAETDIAELLGSYTAKEKKAADRIIQALASKTDVSSSVENILQSIPDQFIEAAAQKKMDNLTLQEQQHDSYSVRPELKLGRSH